MVGVVRNTKYYEPREEFFPICYFPMAQDAEPDAGTTYVPRTAGAVGSIMTEVKRAAAEVSPSIGIEFRPLAGQIQESLPRERLMATLPGAFGILPGLLATLGLYGVISYMVARRRNEIGLRIALGADRGGVIRLVMQEALVLLAMGLGVGLVISLWASSAAKTLLFGLETYDPATLSMGVARPGTHGPGGELWPGVAGGGGGTDAGAARRVRLSRGS